MTFMLDMRNAAKQLANEQHRRMLRDQADIIHAAVSAFSRSPTTENMTRLNGEWTLGARMLKNACPPPGGPAGGALRGGAELQMAA